MSKPIEEAQRILSVGIVNGEVTQKDIADMLAILLPLLPKEEEKGNPAD